MEEYFIMNLKKKIAQLEGQLQNSQNDNFNLKKYVKEIEFKYHQMKSETSLKDDELNQLRIYIEEIL